MAHKMKHVLRLEEENQTPRLFDALYPFRQTNAEGASKIDATRTLLREQPSRTKWVRNRREQFVQHQHLLRRLVRAAPAANAGDEDEFGDEDGDEVDDDTATTRSRKRKRRAAASSSSSSTTSTSATTSRLWEEAARLLPTPFALEKGTLRSLRDLNTRVGLEVVRNTQPPRGVHQLAQHLAHAYPVLMGQLALERALTLAGQSRWRDAYDSLENFLIMPGFRSNPLYASYCGMFLFILSSASRTHEEEWEEDGDNRSEGYKQLLQARQHLETATALHDGPALLHFLASTMVLTGDAEQALETVRAYCRLHPRDPHGLRYGDEDNRVAMQLNSVSSLLELDPASMPGLAATLDLYAKDHLSLAEAIKRVARLVELIPGDESLWALLWQSLEQLAQHHLTPEQEADLAAFWAERRGWWATHFFHLALASRLGLCSETQLYYRALCSRVILNDGNDDGNESAFVRAVRGLLAPAADSGGDEEEEEEAKREAEEGPWGLLFVPPPYIIGCPTAASATESRPPDAEAEADADEYVELDDDADDRLDDEERPTEAVMREQATSEDGSGGRQQPPAWLQLRDRKREAARRQEEASTAYAQRGEHNMDDDDVDVDDERQMKLLRHLRKPCGCCGMRPRHAHHCLHLWGKCRSCHREEGGTYGDEDLSDSDTESES